MSNSSIIFSFLLLWLTLVPLRAQNNLNTTLVGRWAGGPCYAVASDGQYVYSGRGSIESYNQFRNARSHVLYDSTVLDSIIIAKINQYHLPGLQACIVRQNQLIWKNNYGYANLEHNRLVTDSTLFYLASISKTFVATAIMQLWEQGLFNLDDDVNTYLPFHVRNPYHSNVPITLRMLLTHTSSINDNQSIASALYVLGQDSPIPLDYFLVNYLVSPGLYYTSNNYNTSTPGSQYNYSNVGAALLGHLVHTISTYSLEQYCQDSIFVPLGMNETSWFLANLDTTHIAMPYYYSGGNYNPYGHRGSPAYPAGQLRTSAVQLSQYLRAYMQMGQFNGYRLLDSSTVDLMTTIHHSADPVYDTYIGLIWHLIELDIPYMGKRKIWYHTGSHNGASTVLGYIKEKNENVGAIILTNLRADNIAEEVGPEMFAFGLLYEKIYAHDIELNSTFMQAGSDTLILNTEFVNPNNHSFSSNALITSIDSAYNDSISLYDDGNHGDLQAGDGVWGNYIFPISTENEFMVGISTEDLDSGDYFILHDLSRFTSIGPVVVDHYDVPLQFPNIFGLKLYLRNDGATATATAVKAKISTSDSGVINISNNNQSFGNIAPGQIDSSGIFFGVSTQNNPDAINFSIHISSEGLDFWSDSISVTLTGLAENEDNIPLEFALEQNYPNPFNPTTNIEFSIPKSEFVTLKVYNILGEEVATLVSEKLAAGSYKYDWDAGSLASGVYLYRIKAGEFEETKKLALIR